MICWNPVTRMSTLPFMALDTRLPAGMTINLYRAKLKATNQLITFDL